MGDHVAAYNGMLAVVNNQLSGQLKWASDVQSLIVERLTALYDDADVRRKKLIAQVHISTISTYQYVMRDGMCWQ
jgi:hypothetical protein